MKVVVITGASGGIGAELKALFRQAGFVAVNLSRSNPDGDADFVKCDVSDKDSVKSAFDTIAEKYGTVDMLINNAGLGMNSPAELLSGEDFDRLTRVNFVGTFLCSKYALKLMGRGARIINISSIMAFFPLPYRSAYAAAKAAVNTLSMCMRAELAASGISVAAVCPGNTRSNFSTNRITRAETDDRYGGHSDDALAKLQSGEHKRMSAATAAKAIFRITNKRRLPPISVVGGKYKLLYFLTRLIPQRWILKFLEKH